MQSLYTSLYMRYAFFKRVYMYVCLEIYFFCDFVLELVQKGVSVMLLYNLFLDDYCVKLDVYLRSLSFKEMFLFK